MLSEIPLHSHSQRLLFCSSLHPAFGVHWSLSLETSRCFAKISTLFRISTQHQIFAERWWMDHSLIPNLKHRRRECRSASGTDVSFQYPGSNKISNSLNSINLEIKPGELVVIVGENGSGKSTLIRILSRLYDPTAGTVHIDGEPASSYKVVNLHRATAILSQDNHIYPVTLGENIGLGYAVHAGDKEMIAQAAEQGGASEFISKLSNGMDTMLEPLLDTFVHNIGHGRDHPLQKKLDAVQKKLEISGGEKQRLVAARTFMRFNSGSVNFVAVDEPSSALDAGGELHLFEQLIKIRNGKTMIFVTHRFGHLTRYADKIICMKGGSVVEIGTHHELTQLNGEYSKLYDIQARAFLVEEYEMKKNRESINA
ncbi:P-loop containing nucleoside triphosphate hydrolase protein [Cyathus striatus]|nr:P-loop containing nucleoside triphosphate hydrolase protein [Cyathus striatus]